MSTDRKAGPLKQLQGLIWKQGYDNGDIKGHVYDDVAAALDQWRSTDGHKVYIYSSGSVQAQKLLFGQSLAGDLLPRIDGHFDTAVGHKQEAASYTAIAEKIGAKPEEILFLTDIIEEAQAALGAGLRAALVSRAGNAALPASHTFPVLHSLAQLSSNKRKPLQVPSASEVEEEEMPAKVPKTDAEKDVKETAEAASAAAAPDTEQKMEVEAPAADAAAADEPVSVLTTIEEITDSNEAGDAPMLDLEPVVEEDTKTEEKRTDSEAKPENGESDAKPKEDVEMKNGEAAPVAEETPPASTPVIEEVTLEKEALADVVDDPVPVVEEPPAAEDMEVLQNVGEVLDKECDEILSKVQDVTNLDSIPVKPLLNPIAEETMETENTDTNDIVDRILDTELELEMKQNEILNSPAGEDSETKQKNGVSDEADVKQANGAEDKLADKIVESDKKEESSSVEVATEVKPDVRCAETQVEHKEIVETESATESKEAENVKVTEKEETPEKPVEESKEENKTESETIEESKPVEEKPVESSPAEPQPADSTPAEQKEKETSKTDETSKPEESSEPQMNGKATNGDAPKMNGDSEDASSRLPVVNGKATENGENGANGDSMEASQQGQGDSAAEEATAAADIKLKAAPPVEPAQTIEQPTEA
ncbi:enolase-phosphatase E1 [Cydia fagiglandana]|uniref:enolase-phosphatase E1 n=1 Tax=Cydia fagiglandana TaxID=1458189 RepID=UPI002FEE5981